MDNYHCSNYSWISSTGISDPTFWESVFPCENELEPAPKKKRLNYEDNTNQLFNFGSQMTVPTYFDLNNSTVIGKIEVDISNSFSHNDNQNSFEKEIKTYKVMSPTWKDFCN